MLTAVGALLMAAATAAAQVGTGGLAGLVVDEQGARVAQAKVVATEAAGWQRVTRADEEGAWVITGLSPGIYAVRVAVAGLAASSSVAVVVGETRRVDLVARPAAVADVVTVTSAPPLLRDTPGLGHVVDRTTATALPLNGRSFLSLVALAPGVALPPGAALPRINGGRPRTNEYLFDGISVLQPEPGQVAYLPNIDAIEEFRVETNSPPAEFGRFNGGVVNLTTRAGGADWRGSLFDFARHEALNARNAFAPRSGARPRFRRQQFGGVLGGPVSAGRTFVFADYEGLRQTIGRTAVSTVPTALQRSGVFTEPVAGRVAAIFDPATATIVDGDTVRQPFVGNAIPEPRIDPVARRLLERFPLPTSPGTANNYRRTADERTDSDLAGLRVDQRLGVRGDRAFVRLVRFDERIAPVSPLPDGSGLATGTLGPQHTRVRAFASAWQALLSPRVLHELRIGDTRRAVERRAVALGATAGEALGLPGLPALAFADTVPSIAIAGYQALGSPPGTATDFETGVTHLVDTLTWTSRAHTFKAGADLRWSRLDVVQPASPTGAFTFTSLFTDQPGLAGTGAPLASFLLGQVQQFSIDLQRRPIRNRAHVQEYFVQDDWRPSSKLTISAGVRYTLNFPSVERDDQAAVFDLASERLVYLGRDGEPRAARRLHHLNLGPRLGFSWRLDDRTAVRAGYGLVWIEQAGITTPFTTPAFPFVQTVSQRTLDGLAPAFTLADGPTIVPVGPTPDAGLGQGVFAVDRDLGSGYVQQWQASMQRAIGQHWSVEVAYVGSHITRVGLPDSNLNQLTAEQLAIGPPLLTRVANPWFGEIPRSSSLGDPSLPVAQLLKPYPRFTTVSLYRNNVGSTRYWGATARVERRFSRGVTGHLAYTRSRLVDDASSVFDASVLTGPIANAPVADAYDRRRERDVSTGDIPHVLTGAVVWEVPVGAGRRWQPGGWVGALARDWSLSATAQAQSGTPVPVTQATNFNAFAGFGTQRPNLLRDPSSAAAQRTTARWFDTSAFAVAPQFTLGSASRNPVRGPGYRALNVALARTVALGGLRAIEIRAEVFNATNTPPLGLPNGVFGTPAFGTITSAGDPRVIQLAVKLRF
ncbi:TonB-dependent receptor [Luteitalea sp. TBR-22]|uniref:TonB-dependent receptor n=1 Tax=Luteitalea sp. TBR-22 TaxID=2802971 RepID=UPI001EF66603|nr:TonB-dependent receptor [Luteitalea sp. TBR-22]